MDEVVRTMTRQRNHKTQTVNRAYATQTGSVFSNLQDSQIRMGLRASTLWQDFWGVETIMKGKKQTRAEGESRLQKRIAMGIYKPRKPWSADALLGGVRKLYNRQDIEWKSADQERALTTIMSWTEHVVVILPTGAGKSLLFMLPCTLAGAGITVLVVPLVALRGDLLRRLRELWIDHIEWLPGEQRESSLVLVTAEAASTGGFIKYARTLISQQKLDRIVVDECHLTITAAGYQQSIVDLVAIRSLRTQFVYLTATLPPSMQAEFEERNHLLRPKVIRASSNRPNIFYMVRKATSRRGNLLEQGTAKARDAWDRSVLFEKSRDKIILYVRTRDEAKDHADLLGCSTYTARSGTAMEKDAVVAKWIQSAAQPYIVATTAFAEGFDYPYVRLVINVNEPESVVLFAQESGRAGRDGERAYSLVLLPSSWEASEGGASCVSLDMLPATHDISLGKHREKRAMHRYLDSQQCFRTSLSEYLDYPEQRRWCMLDDVPCDICQQSHEEPIGLPERDPRLGTTSEFTGDDMIKGRRQRKCLELARYREDLVAVRGSCLLCRAMEDQWDHDFGWRHRKTDVFHERKQARIRHESRGWQWLRPYTACFWCLNPQSICQRASGEAEDQGRGCEEPDVVLPLCYGVFMRATGADWLLERFDRRFGDVESFFDWLGEECFFGGGRAIQAIRVAAESLVDCRLY
jgi:superfamily II DNA or RNA helicase